MLSASGQRRRFLSSVDLRIFIAMVAGVAIFGFVDGSNWERLQTPTIAYKPAILFALTLVFGWRGFLWSQVVFAIAFWWFLGWQAAILITPLHFLSNACAYWVARRFTGKTSWLSGERSTLAFLAAAAIAPILPSLLNGSVLRMLGIGSGVQGPPFLDSWLRMYAGILVVAPAILRCGSDRLTRWVGLREEYPTSQPITLRNLFEITAEIAVWALSLWLTVQFKQRYGLNIAYLTFLSPLVLTLLRGMRLAPFAIAGQGIVATTLWIQLNWAQHLPIIDLRLLLAIYSTKILVLSAVTEERKRASRQVEGLRLEEVALRRSEQHFRTLANSVPIMIWLSGPDKLCTFLNDTWLTFTGRPLKDELGNGWAKGVHPEDLDRCLATYNSAFDARQSFQMEYRLKTADGTYRWILDHGTSYYREGKFAGYIGSCLDVTERKHWTEQMRASAARLMEAQRLANVGNWERDFVTDEVWCSEEAINMLGLKEEGIFRFEDLFSRIDPRDQDRIVECEAKILASNLPVEIEYRIVRPDREIRFLRSIAQGIRNDQGDLVRIVGATQDITETVKAEEEMQRVRGALAAARDEESRRIARDLHDDISQRLALLSVDLAAASATPDLSEERARTMLTLFRDSVLEISESVRRISHELHPSIVDTLGLSAALEALCHDSFDREKVTVQFQSGVLPDDLHADIATCLYRVTQEALHNVSKHAKAREVSVSIDVVGSSIQLKIDDSGIGFDASSTTDGLGLQSMRERVALVNGSFSVESKIGAGTRIDIEVPLSIAAHAQSAG